MHPKKRFPSSIGFPVASSCRKGGLVLSGTGKLEQSVVVVNDRSLFVSGRPPPGGGGWEKMIALFFHHKIHSSINYCQACGPGLDQPGPRPC